MVTTTLEHVFIEDSDAILVCVYKNNEIVDRQFFSDFDDAYSYTILKQIEHSTNGGTHE